MGSHGTSAVPRSISSHKITHLCGAYMAEKGGPKDKPCPPPPTVEGYPRGLIAKRFSIAGLSLSWIVGVISLIIGVAFTFKSFHNNNDGWIPIRLTRNIREVIPLLLNGLIVTLEYSMGFIHAAALRWALIERDKVSNSGLTFNSNLRLFKYPKGYISMSLISNVLNGGLMALTYTAASFLFASMPVNEACEVINALSIRNSCTSGASYWCPSAILALGIGLLGQAFLTTCQLNAAKIYTWNSSPIATAQACVAEGKVFRRPTRCMTAVHDSSRCIGPQLAKEWQRSVYHAHKQARHVLRYLWAVVIYCLLWFTILYVMIMLINNDAIELIFTGSGTAVALGGDWSLIPDSDGLTSLAQMDYVDPNGNDQPGAVPSPGWQSQMVKTIFLTLLTLMAFQAMLTVGLHCAELLVNLSRDEETWRKASTHKGYKDQNVLLSAITSWKMMLLFVAKPFVHWMFGLAIQFYYAWGLFLRPPQTLYLSILMLLIAIYGTILCFRRPKGPQPATFGHLQTLVDLIDIYDHQLFWGDKKQWYDPTNMSRVRYAGTWGKPLPAVQFNISYAL